MVACEAAEQHCFCSGILADFLLKLVVNITLRFVLLQHIDPYAVVLLSFPQGQVIVHHFTAIIKDRVKIL